MRLRIGLVRTRGIDQNGTLSAVVAASVLVAGLAYTMSADRTRHIPQTELAEVARVDPCNEIFNKGAEETLERRIGNALSGTLGVANRLQNDGVVNVSLAVDRTGRVHLQDFWPIVEDRMHEIQQRISQSIEDVVLVAPAEGSFCTISIPIKPLHQI